MRRIEGLETLQIVGFRGFSNLTVERLGRVNLIVGKNNVGKSSVLEALRLYGSQGSPRTIRSLLGNRDELPPSRRFASKEHDSEQDLNSERLLQMFHLHHNPTLTPSPISIGPINSPEEHLTLNLVWYAPDPGATERSGWHQVHPAPGDLLWTCRPAWVVEAGGHRIHRRPLFLDLLTDAVGMIPGQAEPIQYLPVDGLDLIRLGRLFDRTAIEQRIDHALYALRLIAPDVEQILLVGEGYSRKILVYRKGSTDPVPLKSLGDGMTRVLGIILALVNAKDGMLLVDEIENGIHYSIMAELWRLIFRVADELNVQVFATTHSWDCLAGFQSAAVGDQNNMGMLIRLERRKGEIQATLFDEDELTTATRERIEVR
jgi:hypothetical protein